MKTNQPLRSNDSQANDEHPSTTTLPLIRPKRIARPSLLRAGPVAGCLLGLILVSTPATHRAWADSFGVAAGTFGQCWHPELNTFETVTLAFGVTRRGMLADDHVMLNAAATARKGFDGASLIGTFTPAGSPLIFCAEAGASTVAQLRFHGPPNARTRARYHSKMSGTLRASVQPADAIGAHCTVAYFKILGPDRFGFSMSYSPERGTEIVAESDFREFIFDPDQIGPELNGLKMAGDIELLLDIGGTFTLLVERDINVSVVDDNSSLSMGVATYDARFFDTVSWETDGPVFDLPDGWTVEGDGIINNRYFPEPTIESFAPNQGPEGISVRIRGRHFREVTSAEFGGITAAISGRGTIPGSGDAAELGARY